jgi:hypothetical protein
MWIGHRAYIELADGGTVDYSQGTSRYTDVPGFIAVDEIRFSDEPRVMGTLPPPSLATTVPLKPIANREAVESLARYRTVEASIPPPTLGLAMIDGSAENERVHIRGGTRTLGDVVPRRFLEVLGGRNSTPPSQGSGRLELARSLVDPAHPLVARVIVNRVWKHHFGQGIVRTVDDFGAMGEPPSHPELLDDLAAQFMAQGWSLKALHRAIVTSSAYRMSSRPVAASEQLDPTNQLLHRMNVRRLEAEAIRDALLACSGRLDGRMFGPSVPPYLTAFMEGRGRPAVSGPPDGNGRRSLYLNVRRNFLNPMFLAFDQPVPFSTMGRRNVSNVPAQALALMNDPLVLSQATFWAIRLNDDQRGRPVDERLTSLYQTAFGRPPTDAERAQGRAFLAEQSKAYGHPDDVRAWADLCHVLINVKEFIYIN